VVGREEMEKMKWIEVRAKEWFDRGAGNSYFSAHVFLNDETVAVLPFQYGYGQAYEQAALEALVRLNVLSPGGALWSRCEELDIKLFSNIQTGCKKKEVTSWGLR